MATKKSDSSAPADAPDSAVSSALRSRSQKLLSFPKEESKGRGQLRVAIDSFHLYRDALWKLDEDASAKAASKVLRMQGEAEDAPPSRGSADSCTDPEAFAIAREVALVAQHVETYRQALRAVDSNACTQADKAVSELK